MLQKQKILIVDDDVNIAELISLYLTKEFFDYAMPLIQGEPERVLENSLPRFARLKKVMVK